MKYHTTKVVSDVISEAFAKACEAGHFPKVGLFRGGGSFQCSLWDYQDRASAFSLAAHFWIVKNGEPLGKWTRQRSGKFVAGLKAILEKPVLTPKDLREDQRLVLLPISGISDHYRVGTGYDLQLEDNIVNLKDVVEDWGYMDNYGSCYTWEIALAQDENGDWRPFEGDDPRGERGTKGSLSAYYNELPPV